MREEFEVAVVGRSRSWLGFGQDARALQLVGRSCRAFVRVLLRIASQDRPKGIEEARWL